MPYSFETGSVTDLELGWQPVSPSRPSVSITTLHSAGIQVCTQLCLAFSPGDGILTQVSLLVQHVPSPTSLLSSPCIRGFKESTLTGIFETEAWFCFRSGEGAANRSLASS